MPIISIINSSKLSEYFGRIDAEFYKPASLNADELIKNKRYSYLGRLVADGYRVVYENTKILQPDQIDYNKDCRFLQATNISNDGLWINVNEIGWVREREWVRYPKGRINKGEVLIEVKGQAEKVTIVQEYMPEKTLVTGSVFKLSLKPNTISHEYLFAFFNCKYGRILRDRTKVNTLIAYVSKPELYRIPIYIPDTNSHTNITNLVKTAFEDYAKSKKLYEKANLLFEEAIGFNKIVFKKPKSFSASFSEVVGNLRSDADFYQTKFRQLQEHTKTLNTRKLSSLCVLNKGVEVGTRLYTNGGKIFFRVSNISKEGISLTNSDKYISEPTFNSLLPFQPKKGDILLTKDGTVGMCYVLNEDVDGIISSGIFKMQMKENAVPKEYLALAINSRFCQMQAERDCSGALILHWKPNDVKKLQIPILDNAIMTHLAEIILEAKQAKANSVKLLDKAKRRVEELVEQKM